MLIGVNCTSHKWFPLIRRLVDEQFADFYEILIDNFLHIEPELILKEFGDKPVAFHIMWSRFLERNPNELKNIGHRIKLWIDKLNPIYVSDHLAQFTLQGRRLPMLAELNYNSLYQSIKAGILMWQDILNCQIAFENFPSTLDLNFDQIGFFARIIRETDCQLLFDFSNAKVAEKNCSARVTNWNSLLLETQHFHIAGFRISEIKPFLAIDTHDVEISGETLAFAQEIIHANRKIKPKTIVVERDGNIEYEAWKQELLAVRNMIDDVYVTQNRNWKTLECSSHE